MNSGAGGTESCDWAGMLLRMYQMWAEQHKMSFEFLSYVEGEVAGYSSVRSYCSATQPVGTPAGGDAPNPPAAPCWIAGRSSTPCIARRNSSAQPL